MPDISRRERGRIVGRFTARKIAELQREYAPDNGTGSTPEGRARLARLRRGLDGTTPSWMLVGDELFADWPEELGSPDPGSPELNAVRTALGLYALHQQSKRQPAAQLKYDDGLRMTFGRACRQAVPDLDNAAGVVRRLRSAEASPVFDGIVRNLRSLIMLIRKADTHIRIDYRGFAEDLFLLQFRETRSGVFQRWGRDFYAKLSMEKPDGRATVS